MKAPLQRLSGQMIQEHLQEGQEGMVEMLTESNWDLDASGIWTPDFTAYPAENTEQGEEC